MSLGSFGGVGKRGAQRAVGGMSPPQVPPMRPVGMLGGPRLGGYAGVAQAGINRAATGGGRRRTIVTRGPNRGLAEAAPTGKKMHRNTKIGLGIAGGLAVGTVMNRSGRGSDRGRSSMYNY